MWGFIVLSLTIVELYGTLADENFAIPFFGREAWLGFVEDFFAVAVIAALAVFAVLRVRHAPARRNRESRFYGSHTAVAWTILGMIALVVGLLLVWRAAQINTGSLPVRRDLVGVRIDGPRAARSHPLGEQRERLDRDMSC